jgi:hypothetical protein
MEINITRLNDEQTKAFDSEEINDSKWELVKNKIITHFPHGDFVFIDLGGGNGRFTDRVLEAFPNSKGILLDNSAFLLSKNTTNERKTLICDTIQNMLQYTNEVDIVFLNFVLHHLVDRTYQRTLSNIKYIMSLASKVIEKRQGFVSIYEIMYNGYFLHNLPSRLIFNLTKNKVLARLSNKLGSNTAGVGVCFLSQRKWETIFKQTGFEIIDFIDVNTWFTPLSKKILLHLKKVGYGYFWLEL